jgi:hypothetical protein
VTIPLRRTMIKTPFHVGQSADDVIRVAKRTGRERLALEFEHEGETYYFDLSARTARERREKKEAMEAKVGDRKINLGNIPKVRYFYADCVLTFERNRGLDGVGALCYRVTEIGEAEKCDTPTAATTAN